VASIPPWIAPGAFPWTFFADVHAQDGKPRFLVCDRQTKVCMYWTSGPQPLGCLLWVVPVEFHSAPPAVSDSKLLGCSFTLNRHCRFAAANPETAMPLVPHNPRTGRPVRVAAGSRRYYPSARAEK
jgi:hypothetical protein